MDKCLKTVALPEIQPGPVVVEIETPFGPAAGPNTQLAQNIIAGYFGGARFFELKTVQKMDGAELAACISRPCILAEDEKTAALPIVMMDERMTTMAASRYLNETDTRGKKRKNVIDTLSAEIILQNLLDRLKN